MFDTNFATLEVGPDLTTEAGAMSFAKGMIGRARTNFLNDGKLHIMTMILAMKPSQNVVMVPMVNLGKDQYGTIIRKLIQTTEAVGVLFIAEMWYLDPQKYEREEEKYPSLEHHPHAEEMIYITLEHKAFKGTRIWQGQIMRVKGKGYLPEEFKYTDDVKTSGRFAQFLTSTSPPEVPYDA